ncbi:hypothetical protein ACLB2K_033989 [Fragaria x ananassa]
MFIIFLFIYHLIVLIAANRSDYVLADDMVIDCGPSSTTLSNKVGFLKPVSPLSTTDDESNDGASSHIPGPILFQTDYTYVCIVPPGPKIIQFQFYPPSLGSTNESKALFTISAGKYILLKTSASSCSIGSQGQIQHAIREFYINVDDGRLNVTFTPSSTPGAYAFVNKIKVVPVPTSLYVRGNDEDPLQIRLLGHNPNDQQLYILNNSRALETMYRVNIGGPFISPDLDGSEMMRTWSTDKSYMSTNEEVDTDILQSKIKIKYSAEVPAYTAPVKVYTTTRASYVNGGNTSWSFPLDPGFYYLIRLHFCEINKKIKLGERVFKVYINYQTAEGHADVFEWSNGAGFPVHRDYVVDNASGHSNSTQNLVVAIEGINSELDDHQGILNGLEIFKISDKNNNLAGAHPFGFEVDQYRNIPTLTATLFRRIIVTLLAILLGVMVLTVVFHFIRFRLGRTWVKQSFLPWHYSSDQYYCQKFSLTEMKSATNNFCQAFQIGSGGFGNVYKGYIGGGVYTVDTVAIKRANPTSKQGLHEFQTEITMLSKLRHRHLVSLIGYCKEDKEMILVYDYMAQGTLRDHLYGNPQKPPLPWKLRVKICIGAARGLHYLHTGANEKIIHRDVKSSNILLDRNLVAKVSDFGLSKVGPNPNMMSSDTAHSSNDDTPHVSTAVKGSFGYLDPEYYRRQKLTEKSDVYSFGVVLFEVVCARPAVMSTVQNGEPEHVNLSEWALQHYNPGQGGKAIDQILDPSLQGKINPESLKTFTDIARQCLRDRGSERPTMGDVLWKLELALQQQERDDQVENTRTGTSFPMEGTWQTRPDPTPGIGFPEIMLPARR